MAVCPHSAVRATGNNLKVVRVIDMTKYLLSYTLVFINIKVTIVDSGHI